MQCTTGAYWCWTHVDTSLYDTATVTSSGNLGERLHTSKRGCSSNAERLRSAVAIEKQQCCVTQCNFLEANLWTSAKPTQEYGARNLLEALPLKADL